MNYIDVIIFGFPLHWKKPNFVIFVNRKCLKAISSVKTKILFWNIYITLCNVVREAPDNIAQEKILRILRNVVLLLIGQHCTRQKPLQCCLRGSRQHCIRENLVQCFLNTLGTIYNKSKPYALLTDSIAKKKKKKKILGKFVLTILGRHCTDQNPILWS